MTDIRLQWHGDLGLQRAGDTHLQWHEHLCAIMLRAGAAPSGLATTRLLDVLLLGDLEGVLSHVIHVLDTAGHDQLAGNVCEHLLDTLPRLAGGAVDATDEVVALLAEGLDVLLRDVDAAGQVHLVATQEDLRVFGIAHNVQQVLGEDVEGVRIVKAEHQHGRFGKLVVAGRDGGHPLHAPRVPQLQLEVPAGHLVHLVVMVKAQRGAAVAARHKGVCGEPPEERALAHAILAAQDHLLLRQLGRGHPWICPRCVFREDNPWQCR
uniref:Putative rabx6 n=1 Tax=Ixodes ricinus TaxID=34613 RepID=A0A131Y8B5_IXORI